MRIVDSRSARGQASADYVGVLALVGAVVAVSVASVSPPPLAASLSAAIRHAICTVAGGVCTAREARRAGLAPCVVHSRSDGDSVSATIAVLRLRRGDTVVVERRSDGTAVVSFLDANAVGAQTGVGFSVGRVGGQGTASAGAGVSFNTGKTFEFGSLRAARRFLARYADEETIVGEGVNLARRVSPLHEPRRLPAPRSSSYEGGTWADLNADLKVEAPAIGTRLTGQGDAAAGRVLGRRRSGLRTTWYLRVEHSAAVSLGLVVGAVAAGADTDVVLEVTSQGDRLVSATVAGVGGASAGLDLYGHSADLGALARRLGRAGGGVGGAGDGGTAMHASVELDLTVRENAAALHGALDVLRLRAPPAEVSSRLSALGRRLDSDGRIDVAVYRTTRTAKERSAQLALGAGIGVEHVESGETRQLLSAWSARGGGLREREDCAVAPIG